MVLSMQKREFPTPGPDLTYEMKGIRLNRLVVWVWIAELLALARHETWANPSR